MNAFDIIKTVRITEKGTKQSSSFNQYTLVADRRANKIQIKKAVEQLFKVKVVRVNTANMPGKNRRQATKAAGSDSEWKKAIVTLKKGDKIELA
jgi:large subunit ribosomal protein L23